MTVNLVLTIVDILGLDLIRLLLRVLALSIMQELVEERYLYHIKGIFLLSQELM